MTRNARSSRLRLLFVLCLTFSALCFAASMSIPFFQDNLQEALETKQRQDEDSRRRAALFAACRQAARTALPTTPPGAAPSPVGGESWFAPPDATSGAVPPPPQAIPEDGNFLDTSADPLSTFAVDVDTASYGLVRAALREGRLPSPAHVRVEGVINAMPDLDGPATRQLDLRLEGAPAPDGEDTVFLRVLLRAARPEGSPRPPARLTFLVDRSGSMSSGERLPLAKRLVRRWIAGLAPTDRAAVVTYADEAALLGAFSPPREGFRIGALLDGIRPDGGTDLACGLRLACRVAADGFLPGGSNRIVLLTDGLPTRGPLSARELVTVLHRGAAKDVDLTVIGFGMGEYGDRALEDLARAGNGNYAYVDDGTEADRLADEALATGFETMARDVKVQLRFDPRTVRAHRLLGHERRRLAHRLFRNDRADGGDMHAGRAVCAFYELRLVEGARGVLAECAARGRAPRGAEVIEGTTTIRRNELASGFADASRAFRLGAVAACWAERLRGMIRSRRIPPERLVAEARLCRSEGRPQPALEEFIDLLERTKALLDRRDETTLAAR